ncbi:MAG: hypothetical protein JXL97_02975 [Bacteroidales bacterium]|nr:hypothetical protein [Bacteroidales bacterium]
MKYLIPFLLLTIISLSGNAQLDSLKGFIIEINSSDIYIDLSNSDISIGDTLMVVGEPEYFIHPITKAKIKKEDNIIGLIKVNESYQEYSQCSLIQGDIKDLKKGMKLKYKINKENINNSNNIASLRKDEIEKNSKSENSIIQQNIGNNVNVTNIINSNEYDKNVHESGIRIIEINNTTKPYLVTIQRYDNKNFKENRNYLVFKYDTIVPKTEGKNLKLKNKVVGRIKTNESNSTKVKSLFYTKEVITDNYKDFVVNNDFKFSHLFASAVGYNQLVKEELNAPLKKLGIGFGASFFPQIGNSVNSLLKVGFNIDIVKNEEIKQIYNGYSLEAPKKLDIVPSLFIKISLFNQLKLSNNEFCVGIGYAPYKDNWKFLRTSEEEPIKYYSFTNVTYNSPYISADFRMHSIMLEIQIIPNQFGREAQLDYNNPDSYLYANGLKDYYKTYNTLNFRIAYVF